MSEEPELFQHTESRPIGPIETVELSKEDKKHWDDQYVRYLNLLEEATLPEKMALTHAKVFSTIVGLIPETSLEENSRDLSLLDTFIKQKGMSDDFVILKNDKGWINTYSLINIPIAREKLKDIDGISTPDNHRLVNNLIAVYNSGDAKTKEKIYGLLSGFPDTAVDDWISKLDIPNIDNQYSRVTNEDRLGWNSKSYAYHLYSEGHGMPHYSESVHRETTVHKYGTQLPGHLGYAISHPNESDVQKMESSFDYVFYTLGAEEELIRIYDTTRKVLNE